MTDKQKILYAPISEKILQCFFAAYNVLPFGLPVDFYSKGLAFEFDEINLEHQKDFAIPVKYKGNAVGQLNADFVVENKIVVRVVSCENIDKKILDEAKLLLRLSDLEVCLILNFGDEGEYKRIIFTNDIKKK
jgi:GxxExxY protein